jgi:hypothetical protein
MDITMYSKLFAVALIGWAIQTLLKMRALQIKARAANVSFTPVDYFKEDYLSILISWLTIVMFLFFVDEALGWQPFIVNYLQILFAFVGYTSSDAASRLFSVVNKRINHVIDTKTTQADTASGNLNKPTEK